jgi:hypothetical protein
MNEGMEMIEVELDAELAEAAEQCARQDGLSFDEWLETVLTKGVSK